MGKPAIVLDKRFAKAEIGRTRDGIVCYQDDDSPGISIEEWIAYAVDTVRGRPRDQEGITLEDVRIIIEVGNAAVPVSEVKAAAVA